MPIIRTPLVDAGTVVYKVHVGLGSNVSPEDVLVTLETPDMFWEVTAPHAGVVEELIAMPGMSVAEGVELLRLATPGEVAHPRPGERRLVEHPKGIANESRIHPEIARIAEESARQAIFEVDLEMRATGEQWTSEQIFARQQLRTVQLFMPASNAYIAEIENDGRVEDLHEQIKGVEREVHNLVQKPERTSLDQAGDAWRRHPFLVGFFGADLIRWLRRR